MTPTQLLHLRLSRSCLCPSRLTALHYLLEETKGFTGEVWECGAYRGGTALHIAMHLLGHKPPRLIRAFDTFGGMPVSGPLDTHKIGSFIEADYAEVCDMLSPFANASVHQGTMPASFVGLENSVISLAHIDVDQYESVHECLTFIYPRLQIGGYMIMDDYNCAGCPGAKKAVNDFMAARPGCLTMNVTYGTPQVVLRRENVS